MTTVVGTPPGVAASGYRVSPPPVPLDGLIGWWDAAKDSSFTYYTGNQISQWKDLSGGGKHAVAVNNTAPATRVAAAINGLPAVDSHPGILSSTMNDSLKPGTVIVAVKTGAVTGNSGILGKGWTGAAAGQFSIDVVSGVVRGVAQGVALIGQASSVYAAATPAVIGWTFGTDNVWSHYRNGTAVGTGTSAQTLPVGNFCLGGLQGYNNSPYDGLVGEMTVYNRVLNIPERQQVETYLKAKWGVV